MKQELSLAEAVLLAPHDRLIKQLMAADVSAAAERISSLVKNQHVAPFWEPSY